MNVGLFTSVYFNNIGNGFIDIGAEAALKKALSEKYNIIKVSQCANFAASMGKLFALKENPVINWAWVHAMQKYAKKLHDRSYKTVSTLNVMSIPRMIKLEYLIIPGCVLTVPFFTIYGELLKEKAKQGCRLIFLGASGNFYTEYEISFVSQFLQELNPLAIMTRDSIAFKHYSSCARYSYNGIDNVFFVNLLNLPKMDTVPQRYVVVNIEEPRHKSIKDGLVRELARKGNAIVYSDHKPYPYSKVSKLANKGTIISDYPMDYLVLYKNAEAVYSDRVHACVPAMSFGNPAYLFSDTPRKALFENVGIRENHGQPMVIKNLPSLQEQQILFLKSIFDKECIL